MRFYFQFGQRNNMSKVTFFTNPGKYFELLFDPTEIIQAVTMINDHMVAVTHTKEDDFAEVMGNTNPVLAAYTTTQARLRLYEHIEKLDDRVLYFDTDSVIYTSTMGKQEYRVPIGLILFFTV